jgi:hypothetical protein
MPTKKKMKTTKTVIATRSVSKLDLTKPLKVGASATPRGKSECSARSPSTRVSIAATSRPSFTRSAP